MLLINQNQRSNIPYNSYKCLLTILKKTSFRIKKKNKRTNNISKISKI